MKKFETFELKFNGPKPEGDFARIDLNAIFTLDGREVSVNGFYDGDGVYKIRFYPQSSGLCKYKVSGIFDLEGEEMCEGSKSSGIVRTDGTHFKYDDGSRYTPFGTTVYALVHQEESLIDRTMKTLETSPFNKVRMCVFPKHYDFNKNEPQYFPFLKKNNGDWDVNRPDIRYWHHLERRIGELGSMGIETDLILFHPYDHWGFSKLSKEECEIYLHYLLSRLSALPNIWWSLANEYDIMKCFEPSRWEFIAEYINENDPYGHLLSNHNFAKIWDFSKEHTTHCCLQSSHIDRAYEWTEKYNKPVIFDEMRYEGNIIHSWGNISAREMTSRFWKVYSNGGYATHGETFMDEKDILWWAKGGVLKGQSPDRIAYLKEIWEGFPGPVSHYISPNSFLNLTPEVHEQMKNSSDKEVRESVIAKLDYSAIEWLIDSMESYTGCYKDEIFVLYLADQCPVKAEISLPEDGKYNVDAVDTWEMKRWTAAEGVNGKTLVELPGKEGMALIARKIQ